MLVAALVLILAWGAFAFGAVYPWAYVPLGIGCAVAGVAGFFPRRDVRLAGINRPLAFGLAVVALAIVVQIVPLPHETLMRVNPGTDAFLQRADLEYAALAQSEALRAQRSESPAFAATQLRRGKPEVRSPKSDGVSNPAEAGSHKTNSHALSIDPTQTELGLGLLAVFGVFLLGLTRGLTSRDVRKFAPWLVGAGVVLALVGIITKATWSGKIYGFWQPYAIHASPFGPFVNRNHFAGWMLMGLSVGLGYFCALVGRAMRGVKPTSHDRIVWFSSPEASRVILIGFGVLVMGLALVMTLSRSGITCLAIALGISGVVALHHQAKRAKRTLVGAYLVLVFAVALGWTGIDTIVSRFEQIEGSYGGREAVWSDALHVYRDFPVFGSGINTFGTAMMVYQTADPTEHFAEAHNDYVQLLSEGGLLVTIPALVLLVLFVREVRRRFRDDTDDSMTYWIRAGAVTGLVAIGLQEIVEFSLQMPGNAALFCTLMAIAAGRLPHRSGKGRHTAPVLR